MTDINPPAWTTLRSDIYIRDKGICWICNTFVELNDYDLGHLVDRMNGGLDAYDNLAVMHKTCNLSKPRHKTLEEAMKWKLTPQYLIEKRQPPNIIKKPTKYKPRLSPQDYKVAKQLTIEYFQSHPELLIGDINHNRSEAIRQIASTLGISVYMACEYIRLAGLVKPRKQTRNGDQYKYVIEHLPELIRKYNSATTIIIGNPMKTFITTSQALNLSSYQARIFFYLIGLKDKLCHGDLHSIETRLTQLKYIPSNPSR